MLLAQVADVTIPTWLGVVFVVVVPALTAVLTSRANARKATAEGTKTGVEADDLIAQRHVRELERLYVRIEAMEGREQLKDTRIERIEGELVTERRLRTECEKQLRLCMDLVGRNEDVLQAIDAASRKASADVLSDILSQAVPEVLKADAAAAEAAEGPG